VDLVSRTSGIQDANTIRGLVEQYRSVYTERMLRKTRLYAGMDAVLDMLADLRIPMCVLSNKPHEYTAPICETLLSRWPFVRCIGCAEQERRKPDPTVALELAGEMGRDSSGVCIVGDSPIDVATAHNASMTSIAVTWGYGDRAEIESAEPGHTVDQPAELLDLFRGAGQIRAWTGEA
jgi:phosphoglycolate phosphatase